MIFSFDRQTCGALEKRVWGETSELREGKGLASSGLKLGRMEDAWIFVDIRRLEEWRLLRGFVLLRLMYVIDRTMEGSFRSLSSGIDCKIG